MEKMKVHVLAEFKLVPGQKAMFLDALEGVVADVRAEAGCIEYQPVVLLADNQNPESLAEDTVAITECWASFDHLQAHREVDHMVRFRKQVAGAIAEANIKIYPELGL